MTSSFDVLLSLSSNIDICARFLNPKARTSIRINELNRNYTEAQIYLLLISFDLLLS